MEKSIERCKEALDEVSGQIPPFMWKSCKGVAIITVSQVGFVYSISEGDGVVMKHNDDGTWGPPSAVMLSGFAAGAIFGKGTKRVVLFPMTEYGLKMLSGQNSLRMGVQIGVAAGPFGQETDSGVNFGKTGVDVIYAYTYQSGVLLNIGYDSYSIDAVNNVNAYFYGVEKDAADIIMMPGTVDIPQGKGVEELHEKLVQLSKK